MMPRSRVAVALLPPRVISAQVQGLRSLLADPKIARIPPHLTLVPPVNLTEEDLRVLQLLLRSVASRTTPFTLNLGPVSSFAPATPTLHLAVEGDLVALQELREELRARPIDRPDTWPFTPHVTLRESVPSEQIAPALELLTGKFTHWAVTRLYLLEHFSQEDPAVWRPVLEEPFTAPILVGRGGIELVLRTVSMLEPAVERLLSDHAPHSLREVEQSGDMRIVVAERAGQAGVPVAAAVGTVAARSAELLQLFVAPEHRQLGIGRHTLMHWCAEAAQQGAAVAVAALSDSAQVLQRWGFARVGHSMVRQLLVDSGE